MLAEGPRPKLPSDVRSVHDGATRDGIAASPSNSTPLRTASPSFDAAADGSAHGTSAAGGGAAGSAAHEHTSSPQPPGSPQPVSSSLKDGVDDGDEGVERYGSRAFWQESQRVQVRPQDGPCRTAHPLGHLHHL